MKTTLTHPAHVARNVSVRWTPTLASSFTPVSDFFLDYYSRLDPPLKAAEAMFIIHLMRYKWDAAAPYPAFKTVAQKMGISSSAARSHARTLTQKGYLRRQMQIGQTNKFHLDALFTALEELRVVVAREAMLREAARGTVPAGLTNPT